MCSEIASNPAVLKNTTPRTSGVWTSQIVSNRSRFPAMELAVEKYEIMSDTHSNDVRITCTRPNRACMGPNEKESGHWD